MAEIRINKYLADSGICSRRRAEEIILQGKVFLNGKCVTELGTKVDTQKDVIKVEGKVIRPVSKKIYIMLNKPCGVITSSKDQFGRKTVLDFVKDIDERLYAVGRLDYDTSGLIILTNDGEVSQKITHPRNIVEKEYIARVMGIPARDEIEAFEKGLQIEDYITSTAKLRILKTFEKECELKVTIHEGKNRQVRKMCDKIGHPVILLKRVAIGKIRLANLKEGSFRHLTDTEVKYLKGL